MQESGQVAHPSLTKAYTLIRKLDAPTVWYQYALTGFPSIKYLGVTISSDLSWSIHINSTCTKARKQLGFLYCNLYQANRDSIAYLYKATVLPILDYCCCVWDPYQSTHTAKLEKVQKFAAKLATGLWLEN